MSTTIREEKNLARLINEAMWGLAREVYYKNREFLWREAGFKSFNLYCKAVLPFKSKRLFYWCMVIEKAKKYQIDVPDYFDLPMEFIVEAFKFDTEEGIIHTLETLRTENKDFTWLRRQVMESQNKLTKNEPLHTRVLSLNDIQYTAFNDALSIAEKITGSRNIGDGIEAMSQEFIGTYEGMEPNIGDSFKLKILERDEYSCQWCGKMKNLDVHHVIKRSQRPDLVKDEDNCVTLCRECHNKQDIIAENKYQGGQDNGEDIRNA